MFWSSWFPLRVRTRTWVPSGAVAVHCMADRMRAARPNSIGSDVSDTSGRKPRPYSCISRMAGRADPLTKV